MKNKVVFALAITNHLQAHHFVNKITCTFHTVNLKQDYQHRIMRFLLQKALKLCAI